MLSVKKLAEANNRMVERAPEDEASEDGTDLGLPLPESEEGVAISKFSQHCATTCFKNALEAGMDISAALMHVWIDGATTGYEAGVVEPQREESESAK